MKSCLRSCVPMVLGIALLALTGRWGVAQEAEEHLIGQWVVVTAVNGGEESDDPGPRIEISEDEVVLILPDGERLNLEVEFDHTQMPPQMDVSLELSKVPGEEFTVVMKGIFEIDGKAARICLNGGGSDDERPEEFESTEENHYLLLTLEWKEDDE